MSLNNFNDYSTDSAALEEESNYSSRELTPEIVEFLEMPSTESRWPHRVIGLHISNEEMKEVEKTLSKTVTIIEAPNRSRIYLIGTTHFSEVSQNEVAMVINKIIPQIVMLELCNGRRAILELNEEKLFEEVQHINARKLFFYFKQESVWYGLIYSLFVLLSAKLTAKLGMAPGGEFRRALLEAKKYNKMILHLGDRPIDITISRALANLGFFRKLKLFLQLIKSVPDISSLDIERYKEKDVLDELMGEIAEEFPELQKVLVDERDMYMAYSLQLASKSRIYFPGNAYFSSRVVGVVGIGHVRGITKYFGKITEEQFNSLSTVPPPTTTSIVIKVVMKYSLIWLGIWGVFKLAPKSIKEKLLTQLERSIFCIYKIMLKNSGYIWFQMKYLFSIF